MKNYLVKVCVVGTMWIDVMADDEDSIQTVVDKYIDSEADYIELSCLEGLTVEPIKWQAMELDDYDYKNAA